MPIIGRAPRKAPPPHEAQNQGSEAAERFRPAAHFAAEPKCGEGGAEADQSGQDHLGLPEPGHGAIEESKIFHPLDAAWC